MTEYKDTAGFWCKVNLFLRTKMQIMLNWQVTPAYKMDQIDSSPIWADLRNAYVNYNKYIHLYRSTALCRKVFQTYNKRTT